MNVVVAISRKALTTEWATKSSHGGTDLSDGICALLAIRLSSIIVGLRLPHAANARFMATTSCIQFRILAGHCRSAVAPQASVFHRPTTA